ncbi:HlyD family efflux transporter periplasmic adaptor subunit [Bacteroidales bacterium OttesenSCG-928-K22]|nr:HlyD family efflux transporter periplasmic adaptor subunit [Bacteroidales bacterium OttesenSCG-928-K22]
MDRIISKKEKQRDNLKKFLKYFLIIIVVFVAFVLIMKLMQSSISTKNLIIKEVDRGNIEITVNATGKVIPLNEEIIVSPINSRILEIYKNPGDLLEIGEPILKLELSSVETDYNQKLDEREIRRSKLEQLKINSENALSELKMQQKVKEMQLRQLFTELQNEKYLDSIGASTLDKVRQASLSYEVAELELEQLKQQIENQKINVDAELRVQQLELSIFEKSLVESEKLLKDARILSPQKATLTFVNNQIGAQVGAGEQVAIVSDLSRFKVEAEIPGSYADKISVGSKVIVKTGLLLLEGTAVNITPSVKNGTISFVVILNDAGNEKLRSGLKTDVYVNYGIKEDVLRISNGTYYVGKGVYDMWIINDNVAEKRKVNLGECSFEYVEVISGLKLGDQVIISDMSNHKNKQSIKVKTER